MLIDILTGFGALVIVAYLVYDIKYNYKDIETTTIYGWLFRLSRVISIAIIVLLF